MITQKCIDEIKLAAKIEEVVGEFIPLKRAGASYKGMCPFHDDHSPSMHITPRLGIYKCFVCGAAGDSVKFLMENQKMTYPEALRWLAQKYHIDIEEDKKEITPEEEAANNERDALLAVNTFAAKFFAEQLTDTEEGREIGLTYFKERGFQDATIKKFGLGYCPATWDAFTQAACNAGYKLDYLLKLGLTKTSEKGKNFDFYHGRVIFPIHNAVGKVVGFGGRVLKKEDSPAKYFNSPESEIYHKSDILYGFFFAKPHIRAEKNVYLVEGYTDVISMVESGVGNVVASSGTALTEGQIRLIKSQTDNITVLYDGDMAGIKASLRGINMLVAAGLNVNAVLLPDGEDPDSFAKSHRDSELKAYLKDNAVSIIKFKANILSKDAGSDPLKNAEMVNDVIETIAEVRDEIKRAFYVKEASTLFQLPEEALSARLHQAVWKRLNTAQPRQQHVQQSQQQPDSPEQQIPRIPTPQEIPAQQIPRVDPVDDVECSLIRLILKYGFLETCVNETNEVGEPVVSNIRVDQYVYNELHKEELKFKNPVHQLFYEEYARLAQEITDQDALHRALAQHENAEIQNLVIPYLTEEQPECSPAWVQRFDLETPTPETDIESLNQELMGCVVKYKMRLLESQKELLVKELSEQHDPEIERDILARLTEINKCYKDLCSRLHCVIPC